MGAIIVSPNGSSRSPRGQILQTKAQVLDGGEKSVGHPILAAMIFVRYFPWSFSYTRYYGAKELPQNPGKNHREITDGKPGGSALKAM